MKRIHIAEDEVEIAQLLSTFFRRRGYQVSISRTAEEAMKSIEEEVPDFAILDLFLEGQKSGLDILKFIKEKYPSIKTIVAFRKADLSVLRVCDREGLGDWGELEGFIWHPSFPEKTDSPVLCRGYGLPKRLDRVTLTARGRLFNRQIDFSGLSEVG